MITAAITAAVTALITLAAAGCGETEERIRVDLTLKAEGRRGALLTTRGWAISLEQAQLHAGPVRFFEGAPLFGQSAPPRRWYQWLAPAVISSAHAHPGHYVPGEALGDVLATTTIDLLAPTPTHLGAGDGVSGRYNSAEIALSPAADLGAACARISGVATKGGRSISFSTAVAGPETIRGIAFGAEVSAAASVVLTVDLDAWIARIDFDALPAGTATVAFPPQTQGYNAFQRGLVSSAAYQFRKE
ncbi:MAG: hypothetical protein IT384_02995 [Deltaproteobacteria bacterium]|nr:hypothetical protein [Deltaproteobacteria bacterium]